MRRGHYSAQRERPSASSLQLVISRVRGVGRSAPRCWAVRDVVSTTSQTLPHRSFRPRPRMPDLALVVCHALQLEEVLPASMQELFSARCLCCVLCTGRFAHL